MTSINHGLSGASVWTAPENRLVYKVGHGCREQAGYILTHWNRHLPQIHSLLPNGYVMELLDPSPIGAWDPEYIVTILYKNFWRRIEPVVPSWRSQMEAFLASRPVLLKALLRLYPDSRPRGQHGRVIHGDPTRANTMIRNRSLWDTDIVLIDPIRATGKVPSLEEVDMGKVMQSMVGWEEFLDDPTKPPPVDWDSTDAFWQSILERHCGRLPDVSVDKVFFWCAVHHVRILPYTEDPVVRAYCEQRIKEIGTWLSS